MAHPHIRIWFACPLFRSIKEEELVFCNIGIELNPFCLPIQPALFIAAVDWHALVLAQTATIPVLLVVLFCYVCV